MVPSLLVCVAIYSLADAVNLTFAFALRARDAIRVAVDVLVWRPIMVVPTYILVEQNAHVNVAWASRRHFRDGDLFYFRFRSGVWKSMRVIERSV